jgi:hypothetical protein
MATKSQSQEIYQLKVTLSGSKPAIWRRVQVPADFTLAKLHAVLQIVMGWTDSHLHQFYIDKVFYGVPDPDDWGIGRPTLNEKSVKLSRVLGYVGAKATYTYDFGDGWEHKIVIEKILPALPDADSVYPVCVAGKRSCPPEDCGGIGGYMELLEVLEDPDHEDHEEKLEWMGGSLFPEAFDLTSVNSALEELRKPRRERGSANPA